MTDPFAAFRSAVHDLAPGSAVVLGSGLGPVVDRLTPAAAVRFADVPGFAAPTVHGHSGRLVVGTWDGVPVLLFQGRTHFYEGHPWERVTAGVRLAAELGVRRLLLTNAAGGIREDLDPGALMPLSGHLTLLGKDDWRAERRQPPGERSSAPAQADAPGALRPSARQDGSPYSPRLLAVLAAAGLRPGVYAALTGPAYETPAEIRALRAAGADAVGMSTAKEAEAAAGLGLEVAAISCITNKAAGLAAGGLSHGEVQEVASRADVVDRLANLLRMLIVEPLPGPVVS